VIIFACAVIVILSITAVAIRRTAPGTGVLLLAGGVVIAIALFRWGHAAQAVPTILHSLHGHH
jgi:hypothetical protein